MGAKWTIEEINKRLKAGRVGVSVCQRGDRLSLRATLPAKPGINKPDHQQYLSLGCYVNPAGLQFAEAEAKKVGGLLAQGRFDWAEYLQESQQQAGDAQAWINKFEADYYSRRGRTPTTETTWKSMGLWDFSDLWAKAA